MTSSNGNIFRVTGHLCGEFTGESSHKSQWRGVLMISLIRVWINDWVNNREAGDLRRYRAHYDVIVMCQLECSSPVWLTNEQDVSLKIDGCYGFPFNTSPKDILAYLNMVP